MKNNIKCISCCFFLLLFISCNFKTEEQKKIEAFAKEYPEIFACMISRNYKITEKIVDKRLGQLNEDILMKNDSTVFTEKMFEQIFISERRYYYNKERDWRKFSSMTNLPWSELFIAKYQDRWHWKFNNMSDFLDRGLSSNSAVVNSPEIVRAFKDRWDWEILSIQPYGKTLPWDIDLLSEFSDSIWWGFLSENENMDWNEDIIDEFSEKWIQTIHYLMGRPLQNVTREDSKWGGLSKNPALPWSIPFIDKYLNKWEWSTLSNNEGLPWSVELIDRYKDRWDWSRLSANRGIKWDEELIRNYKNKVDIFSLHGNKNVVWTSDMLDKYFKTVTLKYYWGHIRWIGFCENENIPWTADLLEKYKKYLSWGTLSDNPSLPWSEGLIKKFLLDWNWESLSRSKAIPWSTEIIDAGLDSGQGYWHWRELSWNNSLPMSDSTFFEKYLEYWDWGMLLYNESLPWSVDFLRKYEDRFKKYWDYRGGIIENKALWEKAFAPHLDDDFVIELLGYDAKKLPQ